MDQEMERVIALLMGRNPLSRAAPSSNDVTKARLIQQAYQSYCIVHKMTPGMLVRQKDGLGTVLESAGPLVLWRFLDITNPIDLAMATAWVTAKAVDAPDCLIGFISEDSNGSTVVIVPASSKSLEPV